MLAVLLIMGEFMSLIHAQDGYSADFPLSMLSDENGILTGQFFDSLLLSLPPCIYADKKVDLEYLDLNINKNYTMSNIFTVARCEDTGNKDGQTALSRNIGYQLMNLSRGTQYKINYKIENNRSSSVMVYTREEVNFAEGDLGFAGRSAAMVVITCILAVAMFVLLIGMVVVLLSPGQD